MTNPAGASPSRRQFLTALGAAGLAHVFAPAPGGARAMRDEWRPLFNGRDLSGWTPKIRHHALGVNFGNTFRVEDGLLTVGYEAYPSFDERFGHLFYRGSYSRYRLRVEYRFVGEQAAGGPGWALRNSGVMLHGQAPETMTIDQDFPVSIEAQFLGGDGRNPRSTLNLCTPGTNVVKDGALFLPHCTNSRSATFHGDQWVLAEFEVNGHEDIRHFVNGVEVLRYAQPQLDERDPHAQRLLAAGQPKLLREGSISLQSESHPIQFRRVELAWLDT